MVFEDLVSKLNEKNHFEKVCVDQTVIDSVIFYAKKSYPNEFLAMFDGYVKDKVLYISGLIFLPGERSHTSATFNDWLIPPSQKKWGSVHSHPGGSARPSNADLITFSKHGPFHIIVCEPYSLATMKAYDSYGNLTSFEVGNFVDDENEEIYKDLEEIKKEIDKNDKIKPSVFDLDKDLSFFDSEEEKTNKYSHEIDGEKGVNPLGHSTNTSFSQSFTPNKTSNNISDEDLGSIDLNPQVIRIGGERVYGQSPDLGLIIEIRDGKAILKGVTDRSKENDDSNKKEE